MENFVGGKRGCVDPDPKRQFKVVLGESDLKKVEGNETYSCKLFLCFCVNYRIFVCCLTYITPKRITIL